MAIARIRLVQKIIDVVLAGQTKVIDQLVENTVYSIEYHINMRKNDNTASKTIKLLVDRVDTGPRDSVWSRIGDLNVLVSVQQSLGYITLQLQNNEAYDIDVKVVRQLT